MSAVQLQNSIEKAWENRGELSATSGGEIRTIVENVIEQLDTGELRVAEKTSSGWHVNEWIKKAVLLYFILSDLRLIKNGPLASSGECFGIDLFNSLLTCWYDKIPSKFEGWSKLKFKKAGFRAVPGCFVRRGAYVGPKAVLMPSFINIGAHVGEGTMVDTWATIGSCAQIGRNCHISGGVGIGGVLEPLQASPVIIEDNCFIGARSEVAEGVVVEEGAVLSMGVYLGASTKIIDRETGNVMYGRVPAYSVVVPGTMPGKPGQPSLYCAVIVKKVDEKTRSKTAINDLLRDV